MTGIQRVDPKGWETVHVGRTLDVLALSASVVLVRPGGIPAGTRSTDEVGTDALARNRGGNARRERIAEVIRKPHPASRRTTDTHGSVNISTSLGRQPDAPSRRRFGSGEKPERTCETVPQPDDTLPTAAGANERPRRAFHRFTTDQAPRVLETRRIGPGVVRFDQQADCAANAGLPGSTALRPERDW